MNSRMLPRQPLLPLNDQCVAAVVCSFPFLNSRSLPFRISRWALRQRSLSTIPLRSTKLAIGWFQERAANINVRYSSAAHPSQRITLLSAFLRADGEGKCSIERAHWSVDRPQRQQH